MIMKKAILLLVLLGCAPALATEDFVLFFCGRVETSDRGTVDYITSTLPMDLPNEEGTYLAEWSMDPGQNWGRCASFKGTTGTKLQMTVATMMASWIDDVDANCTFTAVGATEFRWESEELNPGESIEVETPSTSYHVYYATAQDRIGEIAANAEKYCRSR